MRILIIEDDLKLAARMKVALKKDDHLVDLITGSSKTINCSNLHHHEYNFIILDLTLPGKDNFDACIEIRICGIKAPILILMGEESPNNETKTIDSGADGYLVKPFSIEDLQTNIFNINKNLNDVTPVIQQMGPVRLDPNTKKLYLKDKEVVLTSKEISTLEYFMKHPNQVVNREQIIDYVWGPNFTSLSNVVDAHIKNLRKKITQDKNKSVIETIWGFGYRFNVSNLI